MSNEAKTPKLSTLIAEANGWDEVHRLGGMYGNIVISPVVRAMMTDLNMHWLVSDLLISRRFTKASRSRALVAKWNAKLGRIQLHDYDTDMVMHSQRYETHNAPEDFDLLVVPWDGDLSYMLVYAIGED